MYEVLAVSSTSVVLFRQEPFTIFYSFLKIVIFIISIRRAGSVFKPKPRFFEETESNRKPDLLPSKPIETDRGGKTSADPGLSICPTLHLYFLKCMK